MVRPPARLSSRTVRSKSFARSSSANISCPLMSLAESARRPSAERTAYGAGAGGACAPIDPSARRSAPARKKNTTFNDTRIRSSHRASRTVSKRSRSSAQVLSCLVDERVVALVGQVGRLVRRIAWRIAVGGVDGVGLGAQVREHVMARGGLALVTQRADVDRRRRRSARPGRVMPRPASARRSRRSGCRQARSTAGSAAGSRPDWRPRRKRVLDRPAAIDERPPVHRLGRAPGIHVSRDPDQHLGAVGRELTDRLREDPVVADGASDPPDRRVGDRKQRLVVAGRSRAGWRGPRTGSTD